MILEKKSQNLKDKELNLPVQNKTIKTKRDTQHPKSNEVKVYNPIIANKTLEIDDVAAAFADVKFGIDKNVANFFQNQRMIEANNNVRLCTRRHTVLIYHVMISFFRLIFQLVLQYVNLMIKYQRL